MGSIKEENEQRVKLAYSLCKFGIKYKHDGKKVTEVFADVAEFLGYASHQPVANIYYRDKNTDAKALEISKTDKNLKMMADEN